MFGLIMAGGTGTRFWPKSREQFPKQLLKIHGERTMIQQTIDRLEPLIELKNIFIVALPIHKDKILEQLPGLPEKNIIVEPLGKNTAPCIGLGALFLRKIDPEAVMAVLPADHLILNEKQFIDDLAHAGALAKKSNALITLGIQPTFPATGYGYIQYDNKQIEEGDHKAYKVKAFAEKPNFETACRFMDSGDFLWNSGCFVWKAETILNEIELHLPTMADGLDDVDKAIGTSEEEETIERVYKQIRNISIDYGVMEQSENVYVIPGDFGWNDVGTWSEVYKIRNKDADGNVTSDKHILIDSNGCLVEGNDKVIALVGMQDTIVVDTEDAMLICPKDRSQDVRQVIDMLKRKKYMDLL
ncbi:MAG: mannose-1-phosphate guanylyltransferase [Deferribacteres bacterium]|nr:mannose-1-phosphate guanylyltransferase [candidate division KSB1 bacterium]MCB9501764.1 mannose-1-phosphate guanylyltransferase [Deferribacteres bacterium]